MIKNFAGAVILIFSGITGFCAGTSVSSTEEGTGIHDALRMLKGDLVEAVNRRDIEGVVSHLHPNVVITWQNAEVSRGQEGVRAYLKRLTGGPTPFVRNFKTKVSVDELTSLFGDTTGIAFGKSQDEFDLATGRKFIVDGRWTATLIQVNGKWLIASFHASTNLFDNPLLAMAKRLAAWGAGAALALGLILGVIGGYWVTKRKIQVS